MDNADLYALMAMSYIQLTTPALIAGLGAKIAQYQHLELLASNVLPQ